MWRLQIKKETRNEKRKRTLSLCMILISAGGLSLFTRHLQFIHLLKEASNDRLTEDKNKENPSIASITKNILTPLLIAVFRYFKSIKKKIFIFEKNSIFVFVYCHVFKIILKENFLFKLDSEFSF